MEAAAALGVPRGEDIRAQHERHVVAVHEADAEEPQRRERGDQNARPPREIRPEGEQVRPVVAEDQNRNDREPVARQQHGAREEEPAVERLHEEERHHPERHGGGDRHRQRPGEPAGERRMLRVLPIAGPPARGQRDRGSAEDEVHRQESAQSRASSGTTEAPEEPGSAAGRRAES
jgi:hypothetical protein